MDPIATTIDYVTQPDATQFLLPAAGMSAPIHIHPPSACPAHPSPIMVLLPNSEEIGTHYAAYIEELQEFFALHDLRCGSPRELGFLAARLSGRDSFPAELASMVRSFIFREGGAFPLPDLLTVVALAAGGPSISGVTAQLQHPLSDLSAFLANITRAPLDQPPPSSAAGEARPAVAPAPAVIAAAQPFADPPSRPDPFPPATPPRSSLSPALVSASGSKLAQPAASRQVKGDPAGRRGIWVATAVGLPLLLLAVLLFHQFNPSADTPASSAGQGPELHSLSSPASSASLSPPLAPPQTPLAAAAAALAQPFSPSHARPAVPSASTSVEPGVSNSAPAKPLPPPGPPSTAGKQEVTPTPAAQASATPPAAPAPPPHAEPARPSNVTTSVATVTAQQGAFGVSSGIMSSHLVSFSPPKYPKIANFTHAEGQVILQAVVAKSGRVSAVKAITGPRTLRKAAEKAVRQWRYRPYIADGRPADIATIITIDIKAPH